MCISGFPDTANPEYMHFAHCRPNPLQKMPLTHLAHLTQGLTRKRSPVWSDWQNKSTAFPIQWRRWPTEAKSSPSTNMDKNRGPSASEQAQGLCLQREDGAYPLNTPKTRLRTKKEPKITRLTKYTHGSSKPMASFICRMGSVTAERAGGKEEEMKREKGWNKLLKAETVRKEEQRASLRSTDAIVRTVSFYLMSCWLNLII